MSQSVSVEDGLQIATDVPTSPEPPSFSLLPFEVQAAEDEQLAV